MAALKYTKVKLAVIKDITMVDFIDRAMIGGYSAVHEQVSIANNPHIENYDPGKPHKSIILLDCNNQYGWSMSGSLIK